MVLFHILTRTDWEEAQSVGVYHPRSLDQEGFIHFSRDTQLLATARRFYSGVPDLLVLSVRTDRLAGTLRFEDADGGSFPHLYGELNLDAVVEVVELPSTADGEFGVPVEWAPWAHYFLSGE